MNFDDIFWAEVFAGMRKDILEYRMRYDQLCRSTSIIGIYGGIG